MSDDEYAVLRECDVSYFEVTIGEPPARDDDFVPQPECVAVGLASAKVRAQICNSLSAARPPTVRPRPPQFPTHGRQPGWDGESFGYHGDDGRAFHGSGSLSSLFGPKFGVGDVVGCGFSLRSRRIFFTKNGAFVGAPFVAKPQQLPLHAVVGLDARAPVSFNFGLRPFRSRSPTSCQRSTQSRAA